MKKCQILRRTMRTLLQDLAQKSLKGLGTKACTNWEDRSANSLAYQVSNHSIFLYAGCLSLQSSHLMRAILHDFKGYSFASELVADVSSADIFCQNIYGEICFTLRTLLFLFNKFSPETPSPDHDILPSTFIPASTENAALLYMATRCSESISCFCYSVTNFLHHTFSEHFLRVWIYLRAHPI